MNKAAPPQDVDRPHQSHPASDVDYLCARRLDICYIVFNFLNQIPVGSPHDNAYQASWKRQTVLATSVVLAFVIPPCSRRRHVEGNLDSGIVASP
jgi:hypothetical protein